MPSINDCGGNRNLEEYREFLRVMAKERNVSRKEKLDQDLEGMRPLPAQWLDAFRKQDVTVARSSSAPGVWNRDRIRSCRSLEVMPKHRESDKATLLHTDAE
jgi:hypothetical protein